MLCLPVCLSTLCAVPTEVGVRSSRTGGVADGNHKGPGELNSGLLEEWAALLPA